MNMNINMNMISAPATKILKGMLKEIVKGPLIKEFCLKHFLFSCVFVFPKTFFNTSASDRLENGGRLGSRQA